MFTPFSPVHIYSETIICTHLHTSKSSLAEPFMIYFFIYVSFILYVWKNQNSPLSRLLFMSFTMANSKSEWNIYLSMPLHFFMSLENLIINISLIFTCNVTKIVLCESCYFKMIAIWKMFQYFYLFRKIGKEFISRMKLREIGYIVEIFHV